MDFVAWLVLLASILNGGRLGYEQSGHVGAPGSQPSTKPRWPSWCRQWHSFCGTRWIYKRSTRPTHLCSSATESLPGSCNVFCERRKHGSRPWNSNRFPGCQIVDFIQGKTKTGDFSHQKLGRNVATTGIWYTQLRKTPTTGWVTMSHAFFLRNVRIEGLNVAFRWANDKNVQYPIEPKEVCIKMI